MNFNKTELTTLEATKVLPYTDNRIRQLCKTKKFPNAYKIGRKWLIPIGDIQEYKDRGNVLEHSSFIAKRKEEHLSSIYNLLQSWHKQLTHLISNDAIDVKSISELPFLELSFDVLRKHCPDVVDMQVDLLVHLSLLEDGLSEKLWQIFHTVGIPEITNDLIEEQTKTRLSSAFKKIYPELVSELSAKVSQDASKEFPKWLPSFKKEIQAELPNLPQKLLQAIEYNLNSNEFMKRKCDWCPQ